MPRTARHFTLPLALVAVLALSACKTDQEKAEEYFTSGQALLAQGDEDRALVEFRNVFKYDPFHFEARKIYADVLIRRGEIQEAYSQYLRLIEQYPDTPEARLVLAELAIRGSDFAEAERHGREAIRLAPDVPAVQVIRLALDYRQASIDKDDAARERIAREAEAMLAKQPESDIARRIVIDQLAAGPEPAKALPFIDQALAREPDALEYHMMKYLLLAQGGDMPAVGTQLKLMFELFPDNRDVSGALIRWYMVQNDLDGAEVYMRKVAGDPTGPVEEHLGLLQFLQANRGAEAARLELSTLVQANGESENGRMYAAMLASMDYDDGKPEQAIAAMRQILAGAEPSVGTNRIKGMLARALDGTGDRAGAAALVDEILAEDHTHAVALKLRAGWSLAKDEIAPAIQDLNTALTSAPNDPEIFSLLALAQQKEGNVESTGEYLAQAAAASGAAAPESLRHAAFLVSQGNARQAEIVLTKAWRVSPDNEDILRALAELFITQKEWNQAQTAIDLLEKLKAKDIDLLKASVLDAQGQTDEALAVLKEALAQPEGVPLRAQAALKIYIKAERLGEAREFLDGLMSTHPEDRDLRLLSAGLDMQAGDVEAATATYRDLIAKKPDDEPPVRLLYGVLSQQGKTAEATAVLDEGLAVMPAALSLLWLKAGELERDGKVEEAIAAYEKLYAADGSDIVVANNLASLLATHRSDPESLARAEALSRRLRGQENPAFQDTYGWIAFLTGNTYGAIAHLEPAAKGLPSDALTQYHLGKLYQSMERPADAVAQYEKALALAANSPVLAALPQVKDAQVQRDLLKAEMEKAKSP